MCSEGAKSSNIRERNGAGAVSLPGVCGFCTSWHPQRSSSHGLLPARGHASGPRGCHLVHSCLRAPIQPGCSYPACSHAACIQGTRIPLACRPRLHRPLSPEMTSTSCPLLWWCGGSTAPAGNLTSARTCRQAMQRTCQIGRTPDSGQTRSIPCIVGYGRRAHGD